jgi:hypothetical protein
LVASLDSADKACVSILVSVGVHALSNATKFSWIAYAIKQSEPTNAVDAEELLDTIADGSGICGTALPPFARSKGVFSLPRQQSKRNILGLRANSIRLENDCNIKAFSTSLPVLQSTGQM